MGQGVDDMMRIIVDGVAFTNRHQLGIQRYYYEVLGRIGRQCDITMYYNSPVQAPAPSNVKTLHRKSQYSREVRGVLPYYYDAIRKCYADLDVVPSGDVYHSTYYSSSSCRVKCEVVTVHDMIAELYPYEVCSGNMETERKKAAIIRSSHIIAISSSTAEDLFTVYPETKGKTTVIYHGADHLRPYAQHGSGSSESMGRPYVLFVGDRRGYKNFRVVVEALGSMAWPQDLMLHVVGPPFSDGELFFQRRHGVSSKIVHRGRLSDDALSREYANAAVFVFPALCEGFGMPLIEAQINGTPVACSDIPVFRELAQDTVSYFNPRDPEHLAMTLHSAMEPMISVKMTQAGLVNAEKYRWDKCAEDTLRVYENLLG